MGGKNTIFNLILAFIPKQESGFIPLKATKKKKKITE